MVERLVYREKVDGEVRHWPYLKDVPFYRKQVKITLRNCGTVDPQNLDDYLARDGYLALARAISEKTPDEVIEEITKSGLREEEEEVSLPGENGNLLEWLKQIKKIRHLQW